MCYLYKRYRRDGLVRVWLLPREMSKGRACRIVCWPVSGHGAGLDNLWVWGCSELVTSRAPG